MYEELRMILEATATMADGALWVIVMYFVTDLMKGVLLGGIALIIFFTIMKEVRR